MAENKFQVSNDPTKLNAKTHAPDLLRLRQLLDLPMSEEDRGLMQQYAQDFLSFRHEFSVSYARLTDLLDTELEILMALEYGCGDMAVVKALMKKVEVLDFVWSNLCDS